MRPRGLAVLLALAAALAQGADSPPPRRIVSMSPHYTSILYNMGAQDRLVGVTDYCRYPPEAMKKQKVGGYLDPNMEMVVHLKPDLILMLKAHGTRAETFRKLGLKVLVMDNQDLTDVWATYDALGKALGMEKEAKAAKKHLQAGLSLARGKTASHRPTAFFVVSKEPGLLRSIIVAGPGTFPDELMRLAGIDNALSDSKVRYPMVSKEQFLSRDPDLIFQAPLEGPRAKARAGVELQSWRGWKSLKAVRRGQVHIVPKPEYLVPGPGMAGLAEYLREKVKGLPATP